MQGRRSALTRSTEMANTSVSLPLILGISGASGVVYGIRALEILKSLEIETHLIFSKSAERTMAYEVDGTPKEVRQRAKYSSGADRKILQHFSVLMFVSYPHQGQFLLDKNKD